MRMMHGILALLAGLFGLALAACSSPIYPTTVGTHVPGDPLVVGGPRQTYVLWPAKTSEEDSGAFTYLGTLLVTSGHRVVERAQVQQLFQEQRFRLTHSSDAEADLLRVGQMAGATQVIFVAIEGERWSQEPHHLTVTVRSVDVQTGTVRWMGSASAAVDNDLYSLGPLTQATRRLAQIAVLHALCPIERGRRWVEPGPEAPGGECR